ncbi:MAG: hypothetical protein NTU47_15805 [Ignavibacteriales bacterium]|nr:hypothetical protein [Ignavibacteriales bacterium]
MYYSPMRNHRRSIRLRGFDYTQAGGYYVTLCVKDRKPLLGEISQGGIRLSTIGEIVKGCWEEIPGHFPHATLDQFVIMPDHMHGIIVLVDQVGTRPAVSRQKNVLPRRCEQFSRPVSGSLSTIIRSFKSASSKRIHSEGCSTFAWQSRFYEHIIRDGQDLGRIRMYIMNNVSKWFEENENPGNDLAKEA